MKIVNTSIQDLVTFQIWLEFELEYDISFFILLMSGLQAKQQRYQDLTLRIPPMNRVQ